MIPLSNYNWFGKPPLKEQLKDILMTTWILFLCPLLVGVTAIAVIWGLSVFTVDSNKSIQSYILPWHNEIKDK
jgi:hypothetical protein